MKNIRKRAASVIIAAATLLSIGTVSITEATYGMKTGFSVATAAAEADGVSYIDSKGEVKLRSDCKTITKSTDELDGGYYVVRGDVTIKGRLEVTKNSYLILTDGSTLTVKGGIEVDTGRQFNVYSQEDGTGTLYAGTTNGKDSTIKDDGDCGIGGSGAKVYIVGGSVYAKGGASSYGIMGSDIRLYWTNLTDSIYANSYKGTISVYSPFVDKASGSAYYSSTVAASALKGVTLKAATLVTKDTTEFGDGAYAVFDKVTSENRIAVTGDAELYLANNSVYTAEEGITVPRSTSLNIYGNGGKLYAGTRNGTTFLADDGFAGIGSADSGKAGDIIINSGTVYANGGKNAAGIGGGGASVQILGGKVSANGGKNAAGIGSGYNDNGADIKILAGNVSATGGINGNGIGSGYGSARSAITLSCADSNDSIYASSYSGEITFLKTLYTSDGEIAKSTNISGKTLTSQVTAYTVTFNSNGGTKYDAIYVKPNGYISSLPTPTKSNYEFAGWYTDSSFIYEFNTRTPVTKNLTLFAKWNKSTHIVTFVSNGGSYVSPMKVKDGGYMDAPVSPTKKDYVFNGWYSNIGLTTLFHYETQRIYDDLTLYAKWVKGNYTVTFDANGGYFPGGGQYETREVAPGKSVSSQLPKDPTYSYGNYTYVFDGWFYDEAGTRPYKAGTPINSSITLFASYHVVSRTYKIYFDSLGGTSCKAMTITEGDTISQTDLPFPSLNGYTFTGWYMDYDCTIKRDKYTIYDDTTLFAGWKSVKSTHKVTFVTNGGTYMYPVEVKDGDSINKRGSEGTTRDGYTFSGWYYDEGLTRPYSFGTPVYDDLTLFADWTKNANTYMIRFYLDGSLVDTQYVDEGKYASDPYRGGYEWMTASGSRFSFSNSIYQDYDLYATTPVTTYTVRFYLDYSLVDTQYIDDGAYAVDPYRGSYEWKTASGAYFSFNSPVHMDYDLYASSPVVETYYTVTFRADGGLYRTQQVRSGECAYDPGAPRDAAYFDGWYDQYNNYFYFSTPITSDITLYAQWAPSELGTTFGGAGLIAIIAGGVAVVGGGIAAGVVISKKKKNGSTDKSDKEDK